MSVITIREKAKTADGFQAELIFENGGQYAIADPYPYPEKTIATSSLSLRA